MRAVYLAAAYTRKGEMRLYEEELAQYGIKVVSRWLAEVGEDGIPPLEPEKFALADLEDIQKADTFIFFAEDQNHQPPRGSRHVEFGYALAQGLDILVVGGKENLFHYLPTIKHYDSFADLLKTELV